MRMKMIATMLIRRPASITLRVIPLLLMALVTTAISDDKGRDIAVPFVKNEGNCIRDVSFFARTFGGTVFVTNDGRLVYSLSSKGNQSAGCAIEERLCGANVSAVTGRKLSSTRVSSFLGSDPDRWQRAASTYETVDLGQVYPGINLRLQCYSNNVEKLFTVYPGSDPSVISMAVSGGESLSITDDGQLKIVAALGPVYFTAPVAYQEINSRRQYVDVAYILNGNRYGFSVGDYDHACPLIIDPLLAGVYFGGSGAEGTSLGEMAWRLDMIRLSNGDLAIYGETRSSDLPVTAGVVQPGLTGNTDLFVAILSSDLSTLIACTYLGGSADELLIINNQLAEGGTGDLFLTGTTQSWNFPTTVGAHDRDRSGSQDVFVTRLSSDLSELVASTYLGGSGGDWRGTVACDTSGDIFVGGVTDHQTFPWTTGAFDTTFNGGGSDLFAAKLSGDLSTVLAATFVGGEYGEMFPGIALTDDGHVFLSGGTGSDLYPTTLGAYNEAINGTPGSDLDNLDVCISKLTADLSTMVASTFLGAEGYEAALHMGLDEAQNVYVCGHTWDPNYPVTSGAADESFSGDEYYVSKLSSNLDSLLASTFITPDNPSLGYVWEMECSGSGLIYLAGVADPGFSVTSGAYDTTFDGASDGFLMRLKDDLSAINYSTLVGGSNDEGIPSFVVADPDTVFLLVGTSSEDLVYTAGDGYSGGASDAYVAILTFESCCGQFTGGYTGNANCSDDGKRNLADITKLIDRVYVTKTELCCEPNGNADGDGEGKINLADITKLIDHVYVSKAETATCVGSNSMTVIPFGAAVAIDGALMSGEWDDALVRQFAVGDSVDISVMIKHDGSSLLAAFHYQFQQSQSLCFPELLIDVGNDKGGTWASDDWWLHVSGTDCEAHGTYDVWDDCSVIQSDWEGVPNFAMVADPPPLDTFEMRIPFSKIGVVAGDTVGLAFRAELVPFMYGYWPETATVESPATWSTAILEP